MIGQFSKEFIAVNRSLEEILHLHPQAEFDPRDQYCRLQVDERPERDLRIQFSYAGEHVDMNRGGFIGQISVTGVMETPFTPVRGNHVFELMLDGSINQHSFPSDRTPQSEQVLDDAQKHILANWLEDNTASFLAT